MNSSGTFGVAVGVCIGLAAGAAFIVLTLASGSPVGGRRILELLVYLASTATAGVLGSVLAGWRGRGAILGAVTGAVLATALFYTGAYSVVLDPG